MGLAIRKIWGRLFCVLFLAIMLSLIWTIQVRADDESGDYNITNYKVDVMVMDDNQIYVQEELKVNFNAQRHGIIRMIPMEQKNKIKFGKKTKTYAYKTPISNLAVENENFTTETDDGYLAVQIGDSDRTVTGAKTYRLSYTMDFGEDRIPGYDMLYYDIIGSEWDCAIERVEYSIRFEKPAPLENIRFYSGKVGSTYEDAVQYNIANGAVVGNTTGTLKAGQALTVYLQLPPDYFTGARKYSPVGIISLGVLLAGIFALIIMLFLKTRGQKEVVATVEFYPPEGVTSAEVGYFVDGIADQEDITSLFIWLAGAGYLSITGEGEEMVFEKLKELPPNSPKYLDTFFSGVFAGRNTVSMAALSRDFYESFSASKACLGDYFKGKRKLSRTGITSRTLIYIAAASVITATALIFGGGTVDVRLTLLAIVSGLCLLLGGCCINYNWHQHLFYSKSMLRASYLVVTLVYVLTSFFYCRINTFFSPVLLIVVQAAGFLAVMTASGIFQFTDYKIKMAGKLLGLKRFIKTAELDRIKALVEEDPEYFYQILPYAYVFKLTDIWIKQFENVAIEPPDWYRGYDSNAFSVYYMVNNIQRGCGQCVQLMNEKQAEKIAASGGDGKFGGGGGGFSGGGFGGGGGRSW